MRNQKRICMCCVVLFNCQFIRNSWKVMVQQRLQRCGSVIELLSEVGQRSFSMWKAWFETRQMQQSISSPVNRSTVRGEKSLEGWIKCNVDAGFYQQLNKTTAACCFRDNNNGCFILAQTSWQQSTLSVIEGEVVALLEAIKLAVQRGYDRVVFESDSQTLVNSIYAARHIEISEFSMIIHKIKSVLVVFPNFEVKFIRRQADSVAHTLARAANYWASHRFFEFIPSCIELMLFNKMS
ncbi:unnamed protein product [Trifolium pratense]|uniref:Uncharacterized protein n=1 Tax=Trifolium pratense TaxID=57577 RepID=A0ACB0J5W3_TRIPR|nr:unnamed protein product [Trifolium pratense]